jgi:hypothetical protein
MSRLRKRVKNFLRTLSLVLIIVGVLLLIFSYILEELYVKSMVKFNGTNDFLEASSHLYTDYNLIIGIIGLGLILLSFLIRILTKPKHKFRMRTDFIRPYHTAKLKNQ